MHSQIQRNGWTLIALLNHLCHYLATGPFAALCALNDLLQVLWRLFSKALLPLLKRLFSRLYLILTLGLGRPLRNPLVNQRVEIFLLSDLELSIIVLKLCKRRRDNWLGRSRRRLCILPLFLSQSPRQFSILSRQLIDAFLDLIALGRSGLDHGSSRRIRVSNYHFFGNLFDYRRSCFISHKASRIGK